MENAPAEEQFSSQMSQVRQGLTSVVNVILPSQLIKQQRLSLQSKSLLATSTAKVAEDSKQVDGDEAEGSAESDEDEKNEIDEKLVGKGLGNCLQVLRARGILGKQLVRGRNKDQTLESQLQSFDRVAPGKDAAGNTKDVSGEQVEDRVKLQYLDSRGRKLTIKEAYRQMCWKFHGRMPSHRKREKMAQKEEIANKVSQASNALGSLTAFGIVSTKSAAGSLGSLGSLLGKNQAMKKKNAAKKLPQ